jgi:hypothetical protein
LRRRRERPSGRVVLVGVGVSHSGREETAMEKPVLSADKLRQWLVLQMAAAMIEIQWGRGDRMPAIRGIDELQVTARETF